MDVLDKLKNDWKKDGARYPKVSENEIYAMLHKRSSSIVKWILFISIIEFAVFLTLSLLLNDTSSTRKMASYMGEVLDITITFIDMGINIVFMYLFYVNYKKIKNTDKVKNLMANILKSRKIVTSYIMVKLIAIFIISLVSLQYVHNNDPEWIEIFKRAEEEGKGFLINFFYYCLAIITTSLFVICFWLFYKLIYGFLLKRLNKNYQELKKIEL